MGTSCEIIVQCNDGVFRMTRVNWDGYVRHVGAILLQHYSNQEKLEALLALGSISSLDASIECPPGHTFDKRTDGYTLFYHRDRGDQFRGPVPFRSLHSALDASSEMYVYVWHEGEWFLRKRHSERPFEGMLADAIGRVS